MTEYPNRQGVQDMEGLRFEETSKEAVFGQLLETMGILVLEPLSGASFTSVGTIPAWFYRVFNQDVQCGISIVPGIISPFFEHFLPIAEQFWLEGVVGVLKSGPWTETDAEGGEHHLEILAVCLKRQNLLLVQLLGRDYQEKQELLQRFREKGLDYELLFKTQQALKRAHAMVLEKQRLLDEDMNAAAEIQNRFLPQGVPETKGVRIASKFNPCTSVAGDMFNVVPLDEDHLGIYILDVSGHGAPAAMLAVSVCQMLQPHTGILMKGEAGSSSGHIASPSDVMEALDREFPIERFDKFFTIFYGILDCRKGVLTSTNAGHPRPILIRYDGTVDCLDKGGTIIGMGGLIPFEQEDTILHYGDKLILFSDGVTELEDGNGKQFGMEGLLEVIRNSKNQAIGTLLDTIHSILMEYTGPDGLQDDLTLLGVEVIDS